MWIVIETGEILSSYSFLRKKKKKEQLRKTKYVQTHERFSFSFVSFHT